MQERALETPTCTIDFGEHDDVLVVSNDVMDVGLDPIRTEIAQSPTPEWIT